MSTPARTSAAQPQRTRTPLTRKGVRRLALVLPQVRRPRVPVAVWAVLIVFAGIVAILVGNILVSHSTFRVQELSAEQSALHEERDRLVEDISYRESPQNVAEFAESRGMVRDLAPALLNEATGEITAAEGADVSEEREVPERIPGPRADARDSVRPNLRSDERLPVVGGNGGSDFSAPEQREPEG